MQDNLLVVTGRSKNLGRGLSAAMRRCPGIDRLEVVQDLAALSALAAKSKIAVLVLDASWPSDASHKISMVQKTGGFNAQTACLLFYDQLNQQSVADSVARGACGCLRSASSADEWRRALQVVLQGGMWFPQDLLSEAMAPAAARLNPAHAKAADKKSLTSREQEIRECVTEGMTNKEIARWLGISPTTVKTHLQHMFGKLHINHRVLLMRNGNSSMV